MTKNDYKQKILILVEKAIDELPEQEFKELASELMVNLALPEFKKGQQGEDTIEA